MQRTRYLATLLAVAGLAQAAPREFQSQEAGTRYGGAIAGQDWGRPLASGDLDGDGYDDVIVGASKSWGGVLSRAYVLRGGPGRHGLGHVDLTQIAPDQTILGATVDDNLGASIATGDFNGDGIADLVLCASTADLSGVTDRGIAYLIYGGPDFFEQAVRDLAVTSNWSLRVLGPVAGGDMGGYNLFGGLDAHGAGFGNLNGDAYADLILGVHLADGGATQSGRVYVIFGGPFPPGYTRNLAVATNYNVRIDGKGTYDELGTFVLAADLTGDGLDELILPNEYASRGLFTSEGAVHIWRGRTTWASLYQLTVAPADITLLGARAQDELGVAAAVGDFNRDGLMDLVAAAPGADAGPHNTQRGDGFVYGLLGSTSYQTGTLTINYLTATPDFLLIGEFEENLGDELSAGDFDGDGYADIAACERFGGPATNGVVEVLFGRDFAPGATYVAAVDTDLRIIGVAQDRIGFSLSAADVNNDGLTEVLFGTPFNNADRGTAYLFTYVSGDADHDRDVDLADIAALQACADAPRGLAAPCPQFDFDLDEDVDALDFAALVPYLGGPR